MESQWQRIFNCPDHSGPIQQPVQWVLGLLPVGKAAGAWRWTATPPNSATEKVGLYIYFSSGRSWPVIGYNLPKNKFHERWKCILQIQPFSAKKQWSNHLLGYLINRLPESSPRFGRNTNHKLVLSPLKLQRRYLTIPVSSYEYTYCFHIRPLY